MTTAVSMMAAADHLSSVMSPKTKAKAQASTLWIKNLVSYLSQPHHGVALLLLVFTPAICSRSTPKLPRVYIYTSMPAQTPSINVHAHGHLQPPLNNTPHGTTILTPPLA